MSAVPAAQTMTAQEFLDLPEAQHGRPWNLVEGELVVNQPTPLHQRVTGELFYALETWIRAGDHRGRVYMPLSIVLDERNVYEPDILWYAEGHGPGHEDAPTSPMPAVAVEVRSPSTWRHDIGAKKSGYEREGLPELWLVDTAAREVLVFRRSAPGARTFDVSLELGAGDVLESALLPGFALRVERLFGR
jgi:Uma2 family endonuclease